MGMADDLKQVQATRIAGKETSDKDKQLNLVDPGPFADITPLEKPEEKAPEKEPLEEEEAEREEEKEEAPDKEASEDNEDIPSEKLQAALKKYKTPEEAAKAAYKFQRDSTKFSQEAARLRKENEELKQGRQQYAPPPPPVERKPEIPVEEVIADKYYADIERLKEDDPERDKKVVKIMARMNAEIAQVKRQEENRKDSETDRRINYLEGRAKEFGLDEKYLEDFWIFAGSAPKHLNEDDAIRWTIGRIDRIKGDETAIKEETREETLEKVRKDDKEKKRMAPLGKGGMNLKPRQAEAEPNLSLGDALNKMRQQRVYK